MDEKGPLCSLVLTKWLKRPVTAGKMDGWRACVRHANSLLISNACISPQTAASVMGFEPYCSTIFTRAGEIAVPPCLARSRLPSHHPISCIQLSTLNTESSQTLGPLSSCTRDAPRASQTGTITAALMSESYFESQNVCNTTQKPLSYFSRTVVSDCLFF